MLVARQGVVSASCFRDSSMELELRELNAASCKCGVFEVRVVHPQHMTYSYTPRGKTTETTGHKFQCFLVGKRANDYALGVVKGSEAQVRSAMSKFVGGSVWKLTKVSSE